MSSVSTQRIENAIRIVAGLIDRTGEDFWPVLDRLERELGALVQREARLAKYLGQGAGNQSPSAPGNHSTANSDAALADDSR